MFLSIELDAFLTLMIDICQVMSQNCTKSYVIVMKYLTKIFFHCIILSHTNHSPVDINVVDIDQRFVYALPFFMNPKTEIS